MKLFELVLLIVISSAWSFTTHRPYNALSTIPKVNNIGRLVTSQNTLEKESTDIANQDFEQKKQEELSNETAVEISSEAAVEAEEEMSETDKLLKKVKEAGTAGVISYAAWELAFWAISLPVCIAGYRSVTGHFPDLSNKEDLAQLGAEAFAFVNFARFAVPLRIGLALSTTQWVQANVVDRFMNKDKEESESS
eukprot:scaffold23685_cov206-Cylindrotheca_fusiformis.AAC.4